jgi:fermentation-respiration switch protein FrsA (DUF1100 family)
MLRPFSAAPRRFLSWRCLARTAACLVVLYGAVLLTLLAFEDRLVFHPVAASRRWIDPPPSCAFRDLDLHTAASTRIHARWYPGEYTDRAVLICHSRAGNLSLAARPAEIAGWHRFGVSALIFDYPGYGRSGGSPSEAGCYAAADAAYEWLTEVQGVPPREVLLYGRSLGSAVAVELACRRPHRALILVSPFTSLPDIALSHFPLLPARALMRNRFDSLRRIGRCAGPVLIVHGTCDRLVPFALGEKLYAAANEPKGFLPIEGARHADCLTPTFFPALRRFLTGQEQKSGL